LNYPDLSTAKQIAIDIETYDPKLKDMGNGVYRKDGFILGVSLSDGEGFSEYYNIGHLDCLPDEKRKNINYISDTVKNNIPKIGTNLIYDLDWLENFEKLKVNGELHDIQVDECLIDENQMEYNLDFLAFKYLKERKQNDELIQFCKDNNLKIDSKHDYRSYLYKMPYTLARKYAIGDVEQPIKIHYKQQEILKEWDLINLSQMENELLRCILLFRKIGVRIDIKKRDKNALLLQNYIEERRNKLYETYGEFNWNSPKQCAVIFKKLDMPINYTDKNNPSVNDEYFKMYRDKYPIVKQIEELKKAQRCQNSYLLGAFREYITGNDLIHCNFNSTKTDERGTVTGRFSSNDPNLQQVFSKERNEFLGNLCREIFIPYYENYLWGKVDLSQIEYRIIAHYALGKGADELRQSYINNPNTDYHKFIMDLTGLSRPFSKNMNFGAGFGMGVKRMVEFFGWSRDFAQQMYDIYHAKAPYIKETMYEVSRVAKKRGWIHTILNRRRHLIDPAFAYGMYNSLIQGSAADYIKMAMYKCYKAGLYEVLIPHLTVHDELDVSIPRTKEGFEAFAEQKNIMEHAIELKVPVIAVAEIGKDWAHLEQWKGEIIA
jgi:DNA polymerase I-like protein with 3'-5' exonuclease and polymerase domains